MAKSNDGVGRHFPMTSFGKSEMTSPFLNGNSAAGHVADGSTPKDLRESLLTIMSGQYGLLVVVVGAVLPVVETFADPNSYMFEGFYIYMYLMSGIFLAYVYGYLLRKQATFMPIKRAFSSFRRSVSASAMRRSEKGLGAAENGTGGTSRHKRRRVVYNEMPNNHTGSFYLRVGAIGFGIGSMIHSGLTFGHYFEVIHLGNACSEVIQAVKPFLHLVFIFVQMYFIFMNSKMCINHHRTFARFGLMHMAATNICVWFRAIVVETLHEIQIANRNHSASSYHVTSTGIERVMKPPPRDRIAVEAVKGQLPELKCQWDALMGRVLEKSTSYLYPCIIEYSLICASVLYVMWDQVGHDPRRRPKINHEDSVADIAESPTTPPTPSPVHLTIAVVDDDDDDTMPAMKKMSVDCSGSQRGLFNGLFVLVSAVVILVMFFVLAGSPSSLAAASILSHVTEAVIYILAATATFAASWQMKDMKFSRDRAVGVEQTLALISLTGLIAFGMFNIVAAIFSPAGTIMAVTLVSNILMIFQGCAQALFMLAAMRVSPAHATDARRKPGRQWVTFLLVCNFALWVINTFETQRIEHNLLQLEFFGSTAWNIFCHVSVPLGIYFRFHSTVCLSNVWKNAWKFRRASPTSALP
ncbi:proton channel OtopLc-like isoform X3 [Littorina saxatilis]